MPRLSRNLIVPLTAVALLVSTPLTGCSMTSPTLSKEQFAQQVDQLLDGKDTITVEARNITPFPWQSLCFERHDTLLLTFKDAAAVTTLSLPYEEFFVDKGHAPNSLEDICVTPTDHIVVKKKYPGYAGPIEFQKIT